MTALPEVKTALDPLFDNRVYRDFAPEIEDEGPSLPYATIALDLDRTTALPGDGGRLATAETMQVDVWQYLADEDDTIVEDVVDALSGLQMAAPFLAVRVDSTARLVDEDEIVHHAVTLRTVRLM